MHRHNHGFILIALSIFLVVAGMFVAGILITRDAEANWGSKREMKQELETLNDALIKFSREHHRLPCPAPMHLPSTDPGYGMEAPQCSEAAPITGVSRVVSGGAAIRIGAVPVRSLGLSDRYGEDGYGRKLGYYVVADTTNPFLFSERDGHMRISHSDGTPLSTVASFVIVSYGANGYGSINARTGQPILACSGASFDEQENCDADHLFTLRDIGGNDPYDDALVHAPSDAQAKGMNLPCYPPRTPSPYVWGTGCAATFSNALHGTTQTISSTAVNRGGSATLRCDNGHFTITASSCAITGYDGCDLPWGGRIDHGQSVTAYQSTSVHCGESCQPETRTCTNGTLSGSFTAQQCTLPQCWERVGISLGIAAIFCWQTSPHGKTCPTEGQWCVGNDKLCEHCLPMLFFFQCRQQ